MDYLAKFHGLANGDACREFLKLAGVESAPPASAPPPRPKPEQPVAAFDWSPCLAAFTPDQRAKLAAWRGYSTEFVAWLHACGLIGLFEGERIAFPVHADDGRVIAVHYRRKEDGSWRFHPAGTRTAPLIVGDLATANTVLAFESQWDFCAIADRLQWHVELPANTAGVITRGAGNGRLLTGLCAPAATVFAFPKTIHPAPTASPRQPRNGSLRLPLPAVAPAVLSSPRHRTRTRTTGPAPARPPRNSSPPSLRPRWSNCPHRPGRFQIHSRRCRKRTNPRQSRFL